MQGPKSFMVTIYNRHSFRFFRHPFSIVMLDWIQLGKFWIFFLVSELASIVT